MIRSTKNPLVKRVRRLRRRKHRWAEGVFFVEGPRGVVATAEHDAPIETVIWAPDLLTSTLARRTVSDLAGAGTPCVEVTGPVFRAMSERDNPAGVGAVVRMALRTAEDLPVSAGSLFVAADTVADPGNLGTLIRTIDAVGADGLLLTGATTDPYHPTAVKASMGALFSVPVATLADVDALLDWAAARGVNTIGTTAHAKARHWDVRYTLPAVLVVGSEREGLAPGMMVRMDQSVAIPMWGSGTSLNLSVAAGVLLYEIRRVHERG